MKIKKKKVYLSFVQSSLKYAPNKVSQFILDFKFFCFKIFHKNLPQTILQHFPLIHRPFSLSPLCSFFFFFFFLFMYFQNSPCSGSWRESTGSCKFLPTEICSNICEWHFNFGLQMKGSKQSCERLWSFWSREIPRSLLILSLSFVARKRRCLLQGWRCVMKVPLLWHTLTLSVLKKIKHGVS